MKTIREIEDAMAEVATTLPTFGRVHAEYERLLRIMGNVDGSEVVTLVLVAVANCKE